MTSGVSILALAEYTASCAVAGTLLYAVTAGVRGFLRIGSHVEDDLKAPRRPVFDEPSVPYAGWGDLLDDVWATGREVAARSEVARAVPDYRRIDSDPEPAEAPEPDEDEFLVDTAHALAAAVEAGRIRGHVYRRAA